MARRRELKGHMSSWQRLLRRAVAVRRGADGARPSIASCASSSHHHHHIYKCGVAAPACGRSPRYDAIRPSVVRASSKLTYVITENRYGISPPAPVSSFSAISARERLSNQAVNAARRRRGVCGLPTAQSMPHGACFFVNAGRRNRRRRSAMNIRTTPLLQYSVQNNTVIFK